MPGIGVVIAAKGSGATLRLQFDRPAGGARATVGCFVAIEVGSKSLVGAITELRAEPAPGPLHGERGGIASLDLVGEIVREGNAQPRFRRGVTTYPAIGDVATLVSPDALRVIYGSSEKRRIEIGTLHSDPTIPACIDVDDLISRHFAVLGTTGVGKSSGVAVLLGGILEARTNIRVFLLDTHNEYGRCFGDEAQVIGARNLRLPFWMFNFEEMVDIIYGGRPAAAEEIEILAELIPHAKARYGQYRANSDRLSAKKEDPRSLGLSVDTPIPYLIQDLLALIDDRMGRLDNRSARLHYHRVQTRIETIRNDARYAFMFENAHVGGDIMGEIIAQLFQLAPGGKPMTIMQLGGLPAEVIDALVCMLARTAFEFGLWSEGAFPLLFVCEEAHRFASGDRASGFNPTRRALSRIAKEGRKYGVFLGLVTQRPAELDPTIISQCSTLFVMRMGNERDQALLRSAVPDAGANLLAYVPSLGVREVIGFGEGVPVPARMTFGTLPPERLPRTELDAARRRAPDAESGRVLVETIVRRWRGSAALAKAEATDPVVQGGGAPVAAAPPHQLNALEQIRQRLLRGDLGSDGHNPPGNAPLTAGRRA